MFNNTKHNNSDIDLLDKYHETENNYWVGILLQRYTLLLFGVCMKYLKNENEAKDAVQSIHETVLREVRKYKISYFKSWIYMVAKNYCLMQLRNKKLVVDIDDNFYIENNDFDINAHKLKDDDFEFLHQAIGELSNEQGLCIRLFYLNKNSYQEIVDATNYNLMQVKSYIQNGKRNLKIIIEKKRKENNAK